MADVSALYTPTNARYVLREGKGNLAMAQQLWRPDIYVRGDIANQAHINPGRAHLYGAEQCLSVLEDTSFYTMIDKEEIAGFGRAVRKFKESKAPKPVEVVVNLKINPVTPLAKSK